MNRTRRIGPKTCVPDLEVAFWRLDVLRYATQPSHLSQQRLQMCYHPSSAFCLVVPQPSSAEPSTLRRIYIRFRLTEWTFGRMPTITKWFGASTFQEVFARLSIGLPRRTPASEAPFSRRTSTSWCWWLRSWSGFRCRFCTFMTVVPETALVSLRTLAFSLSTGSKLLVSLKYHLIPFDS